MPSWAVMEKDTKTQTLKFETGQRAGQFYVFHVTTLACVMLYVLHYMYI